MLNQADSYGGRFYESNVQRPSKSISKNAHRRDVRCLSSAHPKERGNHGPVGPFPAPHRYFDRIFYRRSRPMGSAFGMVCLRSDRVFRRLDCCTDPQKLRLALRLMQRLAYGCPLFSLFPFWGILPAGPFHHGFPASSCRISSALYSWRDRRQKSSSSAKKATSPLTISISGTEVFSVLFELFTMSLRYTPSIS